jgi:tetratricopeptide (TPR) repeat protein
MRTVLALLVGLVLVAPAQAAANELAAGWQALTNFHARQALEVFDRHLSDANPAVAREARFGRGVALLDRQPVSPAQVEEARALFTVLADSGRDDPAQGARFFLGRIAQHHLAIPDAAEAARQFRLLIAADENSVWGQSALGRLALLEIYELNPAWAPAARLAEAEKLLAHAHTSAAQSDVHYAIADAVFFYRLPPAGALPHLLAAERLGRLDWTARAEVLVQIAELSRLSGNRPQAAQFYRTFLKENPRDLRVYIVKERLAEVVAPVGGK